MNIRDLDGTDASLSALLEHRRSISEVRNTRWLQSSINQTNNRSMASVKLNCHARDMNLVLMRIWCKIDGIDASIIINCSRFAPLLVSFKTKCTSPLGWSAVQ